MAKKHVDQPKKQRPKLSQGFKIEDAGGTILPFPSSPPHFESHTPENPDTPPSAFGAEQVLRELQGALQGREFASQEELDAFVGAFNRRSTMPSAKSKPSRNPKHEAQDLAYEAMQIRDPLKSAKLCTKALDLDPNCVDAFVHLSQLSCSERPELLKHIRMAVEVGERGLGGPKFFKENRGYFWGLLETRPYMRARAFLAQLLAEQGHDAEAIHEYEEMLGLNPNDNQGLRYPLIGLYLAVGNLDGVQRLFKQYEDEGSAVFAWSRVLERFLADDEPGAAAALKEARSVNKHAEKYLAGKKKLPEQMPPYYGIGDENEAIICAEALGAAWSRNPKAVSWLKQGTK